MRLQELRVKGVIAGWRAVYRGAALEHAYRLVSCIEADHRTFVIQVLTAPVFELAEEVVQSAIGAPVAYCPPRTTCVDQEVNVLSAGDRDSIVSCRSRASSVIAGIVQAGEV